MDFVDIAYDEIPENNYKKEEVCQIRPIGQMGLTHNVFLVALNVKLLEIAGFLREVLWERDRDNTGGAIHSSCV